jgi:hypothetical protein
MNGVKYLVGSDKVDNYPMCPFNDEACEFLASLSENLLKDLTSKKYPDIVSLAFWARKSNILKLKKQYQDCTNRLGRGLVFHVTPSNIPVNFAFSWFFSLLAGNANIVRVPSQPFTQIQIICDAVSSLLAGFPEIEKGTAFIRYPVDNEITASFCLMADGRIIWGGDRTVEDIRVLKTRPRCIDVVFPDRYSVCILDGQAIRVASEEKMSRLAELFYNDTYLMDQNACSSPHIVFWQNADGMAKEKFWNAIAVYAVQKYNIQPAVVVDKYMQFCTDAIEYDNIASFQRTENILYRIIFSPLPKRDLTCLRGKCGYFYEYNLERLEELLPFINERYQTITYYGISADIIKEFVFQNRLRGIDRIVPVGSAMDIGVIWDGYDLINMLSRVISTP